MPAKLDPANLDHAIQLYLAGEPMEKIPANSGVSISRLHRERVTRGIPARGKANLPAQLIVDQYLQGASEYALSQQYGVSRGPISRILLEAGVQRRGRSEAGTVRNLNLSPSERKAQTAAANRAARRRTISMTEKIRAALHREVKGFHESPGERALSEMLAERGVHATAQRAIGPYNVDLAVAPVAVEILGGGWHSIKTTHAERTPYILDEGWHLVMVWDYEGRSSLGSGAADYLISFFEEIRRNPPATCQYRVITGQGEVLAACGRENDEFALVPPPRGSIR